jgi:hypothetical protein
VFQLIYEGPVVAVLPQSPEKALILKQPQQLRPAFLIVKVGDFSPTPAKGG